MEGPCINNIPIENHISILSPAAPHQTQSQPYVKKTMESIQTGNSLLIYHPFGIYAVYGVSLQA